MQAQRREAAHLVPKVHEALHLLAKRHLLAPPTSHKHARRRRRWGQRAERDGRKGGAARAWTFSLEAVRVQRLMRSPLARTLTTAPQISLGSENCSPIMASSCAGFAPGSGSAALSQGSRGGQTPASPRTRRALTRCSQYVSSDDLDGTLGTLKVHFPPRAHFWSCS